MMQFTGMDRTPFQSLFMSVPHSLYPWPLGKNYLRLHPILSSFQQHHL
jgi:hypothetical protein